MKKKVVIFISSLAIMMIAYCFFLGNPQSNNLQSDSTSSQAIAETNQSQPTIGKSIALTTGGEEVLSFNYEGIGSDVIVRKNRTFIMRVYYGDKSEGKGYSWEVPALFQYFKTEGMSDGVDGKIVDPFIAATLLPIAQAQTRLVLDPQARYPVAGVTPYANIKRVRINGQPVEKVHEYVDEDGHTWYIWYYRDLRLKPTGNKVTLD